MIQAFCAHIGLRFLFVYFNEKFFQRVFIILGTNPLDKGTMTVLKYKTCFYESVRVCEDNITTSTYDMLYRLHFLLPNFVKQMKKKVETLN